MYKFLFFFFLLLILGCGKNQQVDINSNFFSLKESINLPLSEIATHQGHYIQDGKDFFYSYNINTNNFFVYDRESIIDSVNLKFASANQMVVKNLDSIFIIDYNNRLIKHMNFKNEVINTINFHQLTNQDTLNLYLFNGQSLSIDFENLLFNPSYIKSKSNVGLTKEEFIYNYNQTPMLCLLNKNGFTYSDLNFNDIIKISGKDLNLKHSNYSNVTFSDNYIVLSLQFFNQIYVFNKKLKFNKAITLSSNYTGIDINRDYSISYLNDFSLKDYDYSTLTMGLVFDRINKFFYILLAHKTDVKDPEKLVEKRNNRPFSILVYNENFEFIAEQKFNKNLHEFYQKPIYVSATGDLIINSNNSMNPNFSKKHLQYNIYEINSKL